MGAEGAGWVGVGTAKRADVGASRRRIAVSCGDDVMPLRGLGSQRDGFRREAAGAIDDVPGGSTRLPRPSPHGCLRVAVLCAISGTVARTRPALSRPSEEKRQHRSVRRAVIPPRPWLSSMTICDVSPDMLCAHTTRTRRVQADLEPCPRTALFRGPPRVWPITRHAGATLSRLLLGLLAIAPRRPLAAAPAHLSHELDAPRPRPRLAKTSALTPSRQPGLVRREPPMDPPSSPSRRAVCTRAPADPLRARRPCARPCPSRSHRPVLLLPLLSCYISRRTPQPLSRAYMPGWQSSRTLGVP